MKIVLTPAGGKYGYGFDYRCSECGTDFEISDDEKVLRHPDMVDDGLFFTKMVKVECPHVGSEFEKPEIAFEARKL